MFLEIKIIVMKKLYNTLLENKINYIFLGLILLINISQSQAQVKPFTQRTSSETPLKKIYNIKGDFTMIGNTNLTLQNYSDGGDNAGTMIYVDRDNDQNTLNSSSASLTLSNENGAQAKCSKIIYAGLYWTGRSKADNNPFTSGGIKLDKTKVKLKGPSSSSYTEVTANSADISYPTGGTNSDIFVAYSEVTDYVRTNGVGDYFVGNIALIEGSNTPQGWSGGWGMIIVYENSQMNKRDITILDGYAFINFNQDANLPVSGFNTVATGNVGMKLGLIASEGDVSYTDDYFEIQKKSDGQYTRLRNEAGATNNFFNSAIQTGGNTRDPSFKNNTGLDIKMFDIPNDNNAVIGNNQQSVNFRYGTSSDRYVIFAIAMSVDAYVPDPEGLITTQSLNNTTVSNISSVVPGDEIGMKINIYNKGTEAINNFKITVPIPYTLDFVPGSLAKNDYTGTTHLPNNYYFDVSLGPKGSVVYDFGTLPLGTNINSVLADFSFKVKVTTDCAILKNSLCNQNISILGNMSGIGAITKVNFNNKPLYIGYNSTGTCIGEPILNPLNIGINSTAYVNNNCSTTPTIREFVFCTTNPSIQITEITDGFPTGSKYYNEFPITANSIEYNISNPFPATPGSSNYFAVPPASTGGCNFPFTIKVSNVQTTPVTTGNIIYCQGDTAVALTATKSNSTYILYYYDSPTGTPQSQIIPSTTDTGEFIYYVAEAVSGSCIGPKKAIKVIINGKPSLSLASKTEIRCFGTTTGGIDINTTGGTAPYKYTWTKDGNPFSAITEDINNLSAGVYVVTVSDKNNCSSAQLSVTINAAPAQLVLTATATPISCFGGTTAVTLNTTGGTGTYTYDAANPAITALTAGTYTYKVKDANGCEATASVTITQPAAAITSVAIVTNNSNCVGCSNGTITQTVSGGTSPYTYLWSNGATTKDLTNLAKGTYSVEIKDQNGCTANYTYAVTESGIALVKTATVSGTGKVGDVITYTFAVTNTGNTSLTNVVVTDPMVGLTITGNPIATLAVGASNATIKGTYTITQADIDAGKVVNTALATAQDPKENDVTDISGTSVDNNTSTDTPLTQKGSIVLVKKGVFADTNNDGFAQAGEKINYSFTITNTGNVTVTNIAIVDPMPGLTITNSPIASLLAGANATVTGTYILTQADVDGGKVTNSALATGKDPNGKDVKDISGTTVENDTATTTPLVQSAKLEVIKTASTDGYSLAGDVISYTIEVKNTGTVTLYQILVTDPLTGLSTTIASLAPGRSQLFNENYTITKIDLVNNIVTNTATANGFTPNNTSISASDSVDVEKSLVLGCGTILVHNAFSPNGDGINDVFTIDNIGDTSCYPENTVEIYNRWGVLVFETKNYNNQSNNFEGISRGRTTISQSTGLPTGTYFYILNYTSVDGNDDIQTNKKDGYLYLAK